jgi:hypothetical protein
LLVRRADADLARELLDNPSAIDLGDDQPS